MRHVEKKCKTYPVKKPATDAQKEAMRNMKIEFKPNISQYAASVLIKKRSSRGLSTMYIVPNMTYGGHIK